MHRPTVGVASTGCTSGIDVLGHTADLIREGHTDVITAGASDAAISPITVACFDAIKATSARNDSPETASRPFDRTRNGLVLGEGCAVSALEELEHARRGDAHVYAELSGHASRCNAYSMTGLSDEGLEMSDAITAAMAMSRFNPGDIDYVNAHGSSTKQNDRHETSALEHSLGQHADRTPVSSIKSVIGHSLGAIGALETAACAPAVEHSVIPPKANLHEPDPECGLDYVPLVAREGTVDTVLSVASGFGGSQSALVLNKPERRMA